jgi:hypothetical protein
MAREALAHFVAVVQVMQKMMRIVGSDRVSALVRRKVDPVELRAVMVDQGDNVDGARFGYCRRAVGIVGRNSRQRKIVAEVYDLARIEMLAVRLMKDEVLA